MHGSSVGADESLSVRAEISDVHTEILYVRTETPHIRTEIPYVRTEVSYVRMVARPYARKFCMYEQKIYSYVLDSRLYG